MYSFDWLLSVALILSFAAYLVFRFGVQASPRMAGLASLLIFLILVGVVYGFKKNFGVGWIGTLHAKGGSAVPARIPVWYCLLRAFVHPDPRAHVLAPSRKLPGKVQPQMPGPLGTETGKAIIAPDRA